MTRVPAVVSLMMLLTLGQTGQPSDLTTKETLLNLARDIEARRIDRMELVCIPESIMFSVAMTPDRLETAWDYKLVARDFSSDPLAKKLVNAIEDTTFSDITNQGDIRWGFHFYNTDGKEVVTIYANYFGGMVINGNIVGSKGPLLKTLRKLCPSCADL